MSEDFQSPEEDNNLFGEEIRHRQVSALVPEHIGRGVFSTGAIVTQGPHEFVVDFLLSMNRPHQLVARVILPPVVLAQVINALTDNVRKYEARFGAADPTRGPVSDTPGDRAAAKLAAENDAKADAAAGDQQTAEGQGDDKAAQAQGDQPPAGGEAPGAAEGGAPGSDEGSAPGGAGGPGITPDSADADDSGDSGEASAAAPNAAKQAQDDGMMSDDEIVGGEKKPANRPSVQDVYDDLKIGDDVINGRYANAVMIGHSQGEFFFDFITNFFPRSAVSSRVYLSARQVPRLLDAFKFSMKRYQNRVAEARRKQQGGEGGQPGQPGGDQPG